MQETAQKRRNDTKMKSQLQRLRFNDDGPTEFSEFSRWHSQHRNPKDIRRLGPFKWIVSTISALLYSDPEPTNERMRGRAIQFAGLNSGKRE